MKPQRDDWYAQGAVFARRSLGDAFGHPRRNAFPRLWWRRSAKFGIQGLVVPRRYGGKGLDAAALAAAMEGLGAGCRDGGFLFALATHICAVTVPLARFGTAGQKAAYLPSLAVGGLIGAHAMTEAEAGSDMGSMRTTAAKHGNDFVLNGQKRFVSNAPIAGLFVVYAKTDSAAGALGLTAFLVPRTTPGLRVGRPIKMMGLNTCPIADVSLRDCRVPSDHVLGRIQSGAAIFASVMEWERTCGIAWQIGAMQRQFERVIHHAQTRVQFKLPIGKHQSVANRIVDMRMRIELSRLLMSRAVSLLAANVRIPLEASMTKLFVTEAAVQTQMDALRVFGGYGYRSDHFIESDLRDAIGGPLYGGTSDVQRVLIARFLGL